MPTGQTIQVNKDPKVCAELLPSFCMSHVTLFSLSAESVCNLLFQFLLPPYAVSGMPL